MTEAQQFEANGFLYTARQNWKEYDLQTYDQFYAGRATDLQAVIYKGNFIAFRNKNFHVFPHEDLFKVIDPVMKELCGVIQDQSFRNHTQPFSFVYGENKKALVEANYKFFEGKKYYLASQVRANYVFENEKFDVTGYGDIIKFGVNVANGIDGGLSMQISPYTYRQVCQNGMLHASSMVQIHESIIQNLMKKTTFQDLTVVNAEIKTAFEETKSFDDLLSRIKKERMSHMTEIPLAWIKSRLYLIKESTQLFKQRYRRMTELFMNIQQAEQIAKTMPKRLVDKLEWLEVKTSDIEEKTATGVKVKKQHEVKLKEKVSQWRAFNDITEDLTHTQRAFESRTNAYRNLDKIMVVANE